MKAYIDKIKGNSSKGETTIVPLEKNRGPKAKKYSTQVILPKESFYLLFWVYLVVVFALA